MTPWKLLPYLRSVIRDFNFWPQSEGDSPLKFAYVDGSLTSDIITKVDTRLRRAANEANSAYQLPLARDVATEDFETTFGNLIQGAVTELQTAKTNYQADLTTFNALETASEALEFLVQLYAGFKNLANKAITKVSVDGEPYVTLIISGEWSGVGGADLTTIYASTTLVQS